MIGEANALLELGQKSLAWLAKALSAGRKRDEAQAAVMLREAGMLTAALRALGSSWRSTMSKILLVSPDWSQERRSELKAAILSYLMEELVVGEIRKSQAALGEYLYRHLPPGSRFAAAIREDAELIVRTSHDVLSSVVQHEYSAFAELDHLLDMIVARNAIDRTEVRGLLDAIRPADIAAVESAFGRLKASVLATYPSLPEPTWLGPVAHSG
jgi:hypothetical protein